MESDGALLLYFQQRLHSPILCHLDGINIAYDVLLLKCGVMNIGLSDSMHESWQTGKETNTSNASKLNVITNSVHLKLDMNWNIAWIIIQTLF